MSERTRLQTEANKIFGEIMSLDGRVCELLGQSLQEHGGNHDEQVYLGKAGDALMVALNAIEILLHPDDSPSEDSERGG